MSWPVLTRVDWSGGPARRVHFRHLPGFRVPAGVHSEPLVADAARFHEPEAAILGSGLFVCYELPLAVERPLDVNREPRFWERVRQAAFSLDDGRWSAVLDLYREYGGALVAGAAWLMEERLWVEPFGRTARFLRWFRTVTALWDQSQKGNVPYVREHARWDGRVAWWFDEGEPAWFVYASHEGNPPDGAWLGLAREAVFTACQNAFSLLGVEIRPVERGAFAMECSGWQAAAFSQWFLQKVAAAGAATCPVCRLPFPPQRPNQTYCSRRCKETAKARRRARNPRRRKALLEKARERMRRLRAARKGGVAGPPSP